MLYHALVLSGRAQRARQTARDVHIVRLQRKDLGMLLVIAIPPVAKAMPAFDRERIKLQPLAQRPLVRLPVAFVAEAAVVEHAAAGAHLRMIAVFKRRADRDAFVHSDPASFFFRTQRAARLMPDTVQSAFGCIRRRLGWTTQGRARRPRIHDTRHTFAVRRLLRWYEEGADIGQKMLALSTYLGHARISDTYWYLTGVPELMAIASKRFEPNKTRGRQP